MAPMTNRVTVYEYFWVLSIDTNKFTYKVKAKDHDGRLCECRYRKMYRLEYSDI